MIGRFRVGLILAVMAGSALPAHADVLSAADKKAYHAAFAFAQKGDWKKASAEAAKGHSVPAADALQWLGITRGSSGATFAEITRFITTHSDWPSQKTLEQRAEEASTGVPDDQVASWLEQHPPVTVAGKLRQADIWLGKGRGAEALDRIREVWIRTDLSVFDERSMQQRYPDNVLRAQDHIARLDRLLWDDQRDAARRMIPLVPAGYQALAEVRLGLSTMQANADAQTANVPEAQRSSLGLLYDRVRWRRRNSQDEGAFDLLAVAPQDPDHAAQWASERQILARRALAAGRPDMALRLAEHHDTTSGNSFAELEFLAGWIALRFLNKPDVAYDHFVRLYDAVKLPITLARGAYWAGRAAEAMGFKQLASAWFETASERATTYYGQLAASKVNIHPVEAMREPKPTPQEVAAFNRREVVQATRALSEAGADDAVKPFVRHLSTVATSANDHMMVTQLAEQLGRTDLAVDAAKRASYAGVNLIAEGYPIPSVPKGGTVENPLLFAMARQESAFDSKAVSRVGAMGLMQLMPKTASLVAKALHIPYSEKKLTTDQHYNVTLGRAYLDSLISDFSGSYVLAIASYNGGPARVKDWINVNGDPRTPAVDPVDWVELIPYNETRNYVQRVLENLQVYRYRLGQTGLAFTIASDLKR